MNVRNSSRNEQEVKGGGGVYKPLIGKVGSPKQTPHSPRRVVPKRETEVDRILQLHQPSSNPLYKIYNPCTPVKTEEERGLEVIRKIAKSFNIWLQTHQGEIGGSDSLESDLITILRHELEIPDPYELDKIKTVMGVFRF